MKSTTFIVFVYTIEFGKVVIDQILVVFFYKLMLLQRNSFVESKTREERLYGINNDLRDLTLITNVTLYSLASFYEYKLMTRIAGSLVYTHRIIERVPIEYHSTINWIFFGLSVASTIMTMAGGLTFLAFSYYLHIATVKQKLFVSGIMNESNEPPG